jgi:hypothetical protein
MRDYDKNPIIIKDYNYIFFPLYHLFAIPMLIYIFFYVPKASYIGFGLAGAAVYKNICIFFEAFNKRSIILSNNSIRFLHKDKTLEIINLDKITSINRTFFVIYHKSQLMSERVKKIQKTFFLPLAWLLWYLPIIIMKFFFHLFRNGSKYRLFDAVIIFSNDKFINILPATEYEYQEVRKYFMRKKPVFDTEQAKVFWDNYYQFEELISNEELS